jgi:hypothetical protein
MVDDAELLAFIEYCLEAGEFEIGPDGERFFGFSWYSGYVSGTCARDVLKKMLKRAREREFKEIEFIDPCIVSEFEKSRKS